MVDIPLNPVTPVANGALVSDANPMPVKVVGGNVTRVLGASGTPVPLTGSTSETALATVPIPAGLMGLNGQIRVTAFWTFTNSAGNKTMRVRFGSITGTPYYANILTTQLGTQAQTIISNKNSASSQKGIASSGSPFVNGAGATGSINTAAATNVVISGQLADGADTVTLESYTVEFIPGV